MNLKINENKNNITGIKNDFSDKITTNEGNISSNLEQITDIKSLLPASEFFKKMYSITNQSFKFTSNIIFLKLLEM